MTLVDSTLCDSDDFLEKQYYTTIYYYGRLESVLGAGELKMYKSV